MKKNIVKKISIGLLSAAMMVSMTACNTKIKVNYDYNAEDYVTLGEYKGIEVSVDTDAIENNLINTRIQNDLESNTTYVETTRAAQADDKVTIDFKGSIGGEQVSGFSDNDYSIVLGKDTFTVEGFVDELYGVKSGDVKVVTLTVPEDFSDAPEYAGRKIVFEITVKTVAQPNVPMITDTYAKEYYNYDTVAEYRESIKNEIQDTIDEKVTEAKKQAVLTKLQERCTIKGYPEDYLATKTSDYEQSIKFYSMMQGITVDEYCQKTFNMSFDDYVKKAVAQEMILQAIADKENISIKDYDYKGELPQFAKDRGYSDKDSFVEKYGKDKIVKNMIIQKAQDIVMDNAVYK